jgi:hypothetical protein
MLLNVQITLSQCVLEVLELSFPGTIQQAHAAQPSDQYDRLLYDSAWIQIDKKRSLAFICKNT